MSDKNDNYQTQNQGKSAHTTVLTGEEISSLLERIMVAFAHGDSRALMAAIAHAQGPKVAEEISPSPPESLAQFHETIMSLRSGFDPASVTMSSTNIPDALLKLSSVLTDTHDACQKVFDLIEQQHKIIKQGEKYLSELELLSQRPQVDPALLCIFISRYRALNRSLDGVSDDLVLSQEFQDLCGQKIKKVIKLLCDVECYVRVLLEQLCVELPTPKSKAEEEASASVDQEDTDSLLKEFGL